MTKQEAISYLVAMKGENKFVNPYREKALNMAIDALQERENPLSVLLEPMDFYNGLKRKFLVFKSDTGEMIENCFVLRPDKDPTAVEALRAYAKATDNETLSMDIINWVGTGEQEERRWIPVTERLPQNYISVLVCLPGERPLPTVHVAYIGDDGEWHSSVVYGVEDEDITHWMPLPEPPEED